MPPNAIEQIIEFLRRYRDLNVPYEHRDDAIRVPPSSPNGFEVALLVDHEFYTVFYAKWHSEFGDQNQAVNAFVNGLSDAHRLKVTSAGEVDYRWTIQFPDGGRWVSGSSTSIFRYPFWKQRKTRYLQNDYFISAKKAPE